MTRDFALGIVGRGAELAELEGLLTHHAGWPAAALIEGEAGIGKTSVFEWGVRDAEARGYRVIRCRPAEGETGLSYAALGDLLAPVSDDELADLVEVQQEALEVALLRVHTERAADPRATAMGLVSLLARLAEDRPVVVAVDDVQWLDAASARALEFAFRRLQASIAVILSRRTDTGGPANLGLDRSLPPERVVRLVLGPLSLGAVHEMLKQRLGASLPRPRLVRLHDASGGNPFFALEIAHELLRRGGESAAGERLPVPARLEELIAGRVQALSSAAREIVLVASALSRPTVSAIEEAVDGRADVGAALIEAEDAGLVTVERSRVLFTHPLLASTVYASGSGERRRQLHGRLAVLALEQEERARHLALSVTGTDEGSAEILEAAARDAERRGAQDAAAELFGLACGLTPVDRTQELARRMLGQASALFAAGDVPRSRELAEAAEETAPPGSLRAEVLFLLGRISQVDRMGGVASQYLERALAEAGDDRRLCGRIYAQLATTYSIDPARGVEHAQDAIRLLDGEDEPGLMSFCLFQKFLLDIHLGRGADRTLLERGLELEEKAVDRVVALMDFPVVWFGVMDEFDAARARYRATAAWASERGDEASAAQMLGQLAFVELRAGNWALAERYIEESCSSAEQVGAGGLMAMPLRIRAMIDAHLGRIERARATITAIIEETERRGDLYWEALCLSTKGFVDLTAGDAAAADRALTRMAEHFTRMGVVDALGHRTDADHIEALVTLGEVDRARVAFARLEERGRRLPRLWITTTLPRCRALVLAAAGDVPAALAAVAEGVEHPSAGDLPFEHARTLLVTGQLNRRMKKKGAANEALTHALEIFERLGSPDWADRAREELARVGLRPSRSVELTPTERRVAELAASGLTNREVAEAAFISPKTVEANLSRIYRKLGIRSRAELGAWMAGHLIQ
jgi:DNA-binding CsgD family transcriptional regulator